MINFMRKHPDWTTFILIVVGIMVICSFPKLVLVVIVAWIAYSMIKPTLDNDKNKPKNP